MSGSDIALNVRSHWRFATDKHARLVVELFVGDLRHRRGAHIVSHKIVIMLLIARSLA